MPVNAWIDPKNRKVPEISIQMSKVQDPSYSDEKGMTITVNRFNGPIFWAI